MNALTDTEIKLLRDCWAKTLNKTAAANIYNKLASKKGFVQRNRKSLGNLIGKYCADLLEETPEEWIQASLLAKILGINRARVYRWCSKKLVSFRKSSKVLLIEIASLERLAKHSDYLAGVDRIAFYDLSGVILPDASDYYQLNRTRVLCKKTGEIFTSVKEAAIRAGYSQRHFLCILDKSENYIRIKPGGIL